MFSLNFLAFAELATVTTQGAGQRYSPIARWRALRRSEAADMSSYLIRRSPVL